MTNITPSELSLLRTKPQETTLWLSIYKPTTVFACQVNDVSIVPGDRSIPYDNVTAGSYTNVIYGMTMYIGTTPGARDVGRIRIKSVTPSLIYVAENSDIEWRNDLYLTITSFWEITAMYPRMVADESDPTIQTWYKDYDIAYNSLYGALGNFICMGSHYAGFINPDTGSCLVYYSASGTASLEGNPEDYTCYWNFEGGTPTGSNAHTPGWVTYDTPGHYTTYLLVSGTTSQGADASYRHISIYDRPEYGTNVPILNWEFISLDGSRDAGGYTGRIKIRENVQDVVDGALVVIFSDDAYGSTGQSIGGNAPNRSSIFFVGYILDDSISYNYQESSVEFSIGSPTEIMKLSEGFAIGVNSSSDPAGQDAVDDDIPSAWALIKNLDCKRAIYHYLKWHSIAMQTNDLEFRGVDKYIEYFDADRESLYDAINNLMNGTLYGDLVCDRQGKLWAEVSVAATDDAISTFDNVFDIDKQDWIGNPSIEESYNEKVSYLEMGGIQFTPAPTGTFVGTWAAYLACSPGIAPSYRGSVRKLEGLALNSQEDLNTLCGNIFAYLNSRYAHVGLDLSGNYRNLDIAPQEIVSLTVQPTDTPKGITWNKKSFHITEMSWSYDAQKGVLLPRISLHEITQGFSATTITIPPVPPTTDPGGGGWDIPPIVIPPITVNAFIYIYHNGIFVAVVNGLNFVDSA